MNKIEDFLAKEREVTRLMKAYTFESAERDCGGCCPAFTVMVSGNHLKFKGSFLRHAEIPRLVAYLNGLTSESEK